MTNPNTSPPPGHEAEAGTDVDTRRLGMSMEFICDYTADTTADATAASGHSDVQRQRACTERSHWGRAAQTC